MDRFQSLVQRALRRPACIRGELRRIGDIQRLIAWTHSAVTQCRLQVGLGRNRIQHFLDGDSAVKTAAEVVDLSGCPFALLMRRLHGFDEIMHIQDVADLAAVAIDRDGLALKNGVHKVRYPTLVLRAELPWPGDA